MFVILIISVITRLFFFSETILLEKKKHSGKVQRLQNFCISYPKACSIFLCLTSFCKN